MDETLELEIVKRVKGICRRAADDSKCKVRDRCPKVYCGSAIEEAQGIMGLLRDRGYAKLCPDQTLPSVSDSTGRGLTFAQEYTTKQMWRQGWRKVEQER